MFDSAYEFEKFSLKYPNDVPKGYDISKMKYTFDFINLVLNQDTSIELAVKSVAFRYNLSADELFAYLVENKYILNNQNIRQFSIQIKSYNTKALKKILKKHGLKTSGKREHIEKRIFENKLIGIEYYLSSKSRVFYKNKKRRVKIFDEYLSDNYYFGEFNEFYMDNFRKKEANIPIEFIKRHITKSVEEKNHTNFTFNTYIMAKHFFRKENCRNMLEYVLKNYCMNLNPIWRIDELEKHGGFSPEIYNLLIYLNGRLSKNIIINTYYLIWDSFDFEKVIVSKYDGYRCLKNILNLKSYDRIVEDLQNRFYDNEDLKIKTITQKTLFDF